MPQVILLQIGQCGNRLGDSFWRQVLRQHQLNEVGQRLNTSETPNTYFRETKRGYQPLCLQIDFGSSCLDQVRGGPLGKFYSMANQIEGKFGSGGTWASGMYGESSKSILDDTAEAFDKISELCDSLHGVQMLHSTTGGTGSGFGSQLLRRIMESYPDRISQTFSQLPSVNFSNNVVEIYNSVLSFHYLMDTSSMTNYFQNQSLAKICQRNKHNLQPTYENMNEIVAQAVAGTTNSMRFPSTLNTSMRKLATNLIPFPRLHFFTTGIASLSSANQLGVRSLISSAYSKQALLTTIDWRQGRFFSTANIFSGSHSHSEVQQQLFKFKQSNSDKFYEWIPDNTHYSVSNQPGPPTLLSIMNSSNVRLLFKQISQKFTAMFRRKAFIQHFISEGMDQMQFTEAQSNMNDIICEFPEMMYSGEFDEMDFEFEQNDDDDDS